MDLKAYILSTYISYDIGQGRLDQGNHKYTLIILYNPLDYAQHQDIKIILNICFYESCIFFFSQPKRNRNILLFSLHNISLLLMTNFRLQKQSETKKHSPLLSYIAIFINNMKPFFCPYLISFSFSTDIQRLLFKSGAMAKLRKQKVLDDNGFSLQRT